MSDLHIGTEQWFMVIHLHATVRRLLLHLVMDPPLHKEALIKLTFFFQSFECQIAGVQVEIQMYIY
jgi:hypothetical protein